MSDKQRLFNLSNESPGYQLFVSIVIILIVGFSILFVLTYSGMLIFGTDLSVLTQTNSEIDGGNTAFLRYLIVVQDTAIFIIPALIIMKLMRQKGLLASYFIKPQLKDIALVILMTFCLFPVTNFTGQINASMHLPSWMSGVEQWMIEKENTADNLIGSLVVTNTFHGLLLNIFIVAVVPAFAEELIFRGIFQKIFNRLFRSAHAAVWVTAVFFSTIHFQFFGFIPRFILGLAFGYLFLWSGTLWLPILAHFVNNAFPMVITFGQSLEKINETSAVSLWKQLVFLPIPVVLIFAILIYFKRKNPQGISLRAGPGF